MFFFAFPLILQTSDARFDAIYNTFVGCGAFRKVWESIKKYLPKSSEIPPKIGPGASKNTFKKRSLKRTRILTEFGIQKLQIEARILPKWSRKTPQNDAKSSPKTASVSHSNFDGFRRPLGRPFRSDTASKFLSAHK